MRNQTTRRRGAAVVEFAVVLPLLLLLLFGIIEMGRLLMVQQILTNASREGSRHGSLPGASAATVVSRVQSFLAGAGITTADVAVEVGAGVDVPVTVTVTVPYQDVSWVVGFLPLGNRSLSASCVMRREPVGL